MQKHCTRCDRERLVNDFCKDRKNPDGLNRWCRECTKSYKASHYQSNRASILADCAETYRKKREEIKARARRYYAANRERCVAAACKYQRDNKDHVNARMRAWGAGKRRTDIQYKLKGTLRTRLRRALFGITKCPVSAVRDLGCSIEFLQSWIEGKFHDGMTWANHGKHWHLDHVLPLSTFDLSIPDQARIAVHYTNLQPMLASQNISKGGRNRPAFRKPPTD